MKLKYFFEPVDMGDEIIAVPIGEGSDEVHGVLKLNKSGMEILSMLRDEISIDEIINRLSKIYEGNPTAISKHVNEAIDNLRTYNLIQE